MTATPPTPEEQVLFLRNIQRLLVEGQFTASYKFALLLAIADLCVLKGDDSGAALDLDVRDIAEKFIELYWQQCRPFQLGNQSTGLILQQNTGKQAAVISKIIKAQGDFGGSLAKLNSPLKNCPGGHQQEQYCLPMRWSGRNRDGDAAASGRTAG